MARKSKLTANEVVAVPSNDPAAEVSAPAHTVAHELSLRAPVDAPARGVAVVAQSAPATAEHHYVRLAILSGAVAVSMVALLVYAQQHAGKSDGLAVSALDTVRARVGSVVTSNVVAEPATAPAPLYLRNPLVATAAVVIDVTTGDVLYDARADDVLPLASLTKLMTAHVVASLMQGSDRVVITREALATEGYDSLREGEVWTVDALIDYMLITSSNKAARALRDAGQAALDAQYQHVDFIGYMNAASKRMGMQSTTFTSETGLDIERDTVATNFGSALDVATLLSYIVVHEPHLLEATEDERDRLTTLTGLEHTAVTTNKALADIPGLIGGKTGYTDVAGGNLAIAFDVEPGHPIVAVVLGSGKDERFSDMLTLVESVRNQFGVSGERLVRMPM